MQYMLLIYSEEGGWDKLTKAEQEQGMAAYTAYGQALKAAGAYVSATGCSQVPRRPPCG